MRILGISGLAGVGKDTVSDYLVNDFSFVQVAFADPIKRAAMDWWDFTEEQLWGSSEMRNEIDERYGISPRQVLQKIGTDIARKIDKDVWLNYGLKTARQLLQRPTELGYDRTVGVINQKRECPIEGVVLSDARFSNELLRIRKEGGFLIRIKRPDAGLSGDAGKHLSETEHQWWPDLEFDYVINNDGSLSDLHYTVKDMANELWGFTSRVEKKQLELF